MKVVLFKLDIPGNKYDWLFRDIEIKILEDIEQIEGYCAKHMYVELYQIDEDDDPAIVEKVKELISALYPETAKDIIMMLFKYFKRIAEVWDEQRDQRSL